jgi:predicted amidohydrolase
MTVIQIALLQMAACGADRERNRQKGETFCRRAKDMGADIALFPEMWSNGYTPYSPKVWEMDYDPLALDAEQRKLRDRWQAQAIDVDDAFVVHFQALARELEMAIALTYLEKWPSAPRNTVSLIDRSGEIVLTYAKVHTCDFSMEAACTPGDGFRVCALDTAQGPVQIGAMICYDREFPESARILMLKGAEIILTPNACGLERHRLEQFRSRAFENMVGLAMANYAAPSCNGHSIAVDGMAFDREGRSRDMLILEAGECEGIHMATFDLDALRDYRSREAFGNAYRKPSRYGQLVSTAVEAPFLRQDARR